MKCTLLTENRTGKGRFLAEHGLSLWIEFDGMNILFDAGQTDVYAHNAKILGVDLTKTDFIVLSHGHYDHTGGIAHFPHSGKLPPIYIREKAFERKLTLNPDKLTHREIGIPWKSTRTDYAKSLVFTSEKTQIAENVYTISNIPLAVEFEQPFPGLLVENDGKKIVDPMSDEQMLVFDTPEGLSIFIGCSHPGIANCLSHALSLFPGKRIRTLFAGMHLEVVSEERFEQTLNVLHGLQIEKIIPVHCTGVLQACRIKEAFGEHCQLFGAGDRFEL